MSEGACPERSRRAAPACQTGDLSAANAFPYQRPDDLLILLPTRLELDRQGVPIDFETPRQPSPDISWSQGSLENVRHGTRRPIGLVPTKLCVRASDLGKVVPLRGRRDFTRAARPMALHQLDRHVPCGVVDQVPRRI